MADEIVWPVEEIPGDDFVYMRAHGDHFRLRMLLPGVFRNQGSGMSVDRDKYSSPEESLQRARKPQNNAIIRLPVIEIRDIDGLTVQHTPKSENRAHTDVFGLPEGERLTEVRLLLLNLARVVISVPQ